jgi:hypothetical protein
MGQFFSKDEVRCLSLFCLISQIEDLEYGKIIHMLHSGNERRVNELEGNIPHKTPFRFHLARFSIGCL